MARQNLSAVLSRHIGFIGGLLLAAPLLLLSIEAKGEDFRILMVRESGVDAATGRLSGQLVVNAGYTGGLTEGMTGVVWRKNKIKGQVEIADLTVQSVNACDATCKFVVRVSDFQVLKKDRASLTPLPPAEADILSRGITAMDNRQCCDALLYFEKIYCPSRDNTFVQGQISQCLSQVENRLSGGLSDEERQTERMRQWQNLELAEGHHQYGNELAAYLYLRRVLAVDSTNATAVALRDSIPQQDLTALFSPERCK